MEKERAMSKIAFDFNNMMADVIGSHGISAEEIEDAKQMLDGAHDAMTSKPMGFRRLPKGQEDLLDGLTAVGKQIRERYDHFVILGIGGSALGPLCVYHALAGGKDVGIEFFVEDNVDPERLDALFQRIDLSKTMFNVISKSGKTSEPMAQLMLVADRLKQNGLPLGDHIVATTDENRGNLVRIAQQENLQMFYIPDDVGGRFSELCPVGLLPAAVCGFDIRAMLEGAAYMDTLCSRKENNPAAIYALLHVLGMKRGMNISVMFPYADSLRWMADWYAQLWAESLGKRYDISGKEVFSGQTPVKALGATDQHSQLQLYTEGPFDKIITFLKVERFRQNVDIPKAFEYIDDIAFLGGKTFGGLLNAEVSGTQYALLRAGRPHMTISLGEISEYSIGALMHFFEMATAYAGEMLGINTFDQPGVEEGKLAMFALMGKPGFEQKKSEMENIPLKNEKWIIQG